MSRIFFLDCLFNLFGLLSKYVKTFRLISCVNLFDKVFKLSIIFLKVFNDNFQLSLSFNNKILRLPSFNSLVLDLVIFLLTQFLKVLNLLNLPLHKLRKVILFTLMLLEKLLKCNNSVRILRLLILVLFYDLVIMLS